MLDSHSKRVTERTIKVARQYGIPEKEIQKWAIARAMFDSREGKRIGSLLKKLERNLLVQSIIGKVEPYLYTPDSDEIQN